MGSFPDDYEIGPGLLLVVLSFGGAVPAGGDFEAFLASL